MTNRTFREEKYLFVVKHLLITVGVKIDLFTTSSIWLGCHVDAFLLKKRPIMFVLSSEPP